MPKETEVNFRDTNPEILSPDKVRILIPYNPEFAHYNAAVIKSKTNPDNLLLFIREVPLANVKSGTPDRGNMIVYLSTPDKVEKISQLDLLHPDINNWEDARAFTSDETDEVLIGMTAIRSSDNQPVAATINGKIIDNNFFINQDSLKVYLNDEGKNVTPISLTEFLFRRKGFGHSLEVVKNSLDDLGQNKLEVTKTVNFPKKSWCEWQIGTQAQKLPNGILPIHGVNKVGDKYTYSLGLSRLDENNNVIQMTDKSLFNRESFKNILPMGVELDPNKDVIYCCGYSVREDNVQFIINIGDLMTVEVTKSLAELDNLLNNSPSLISSDFSGEIDNNQAA